MMNVQAATSHINTASEYLRLDGFQRRVSVSLQPTAYHTSDSTQVN